MKKKIIYVLLAIFLFAVAIIVWQKKKLSVEKQKAEEISAQPTVVEEETIILPGKIESEAKVNLKFQTSGMLVWIGVKEGDQVKKWQAIASLDKRQLTKQFQKEMNDYLNERWDFEQTQDDYRQTRESSLVTDEIKRILEKAQFDLNNSVIDAEIADLAVKYATLVSPIAGIVTRIDEPVAGVNITPATAVFTIVDPANLYFEAETDEEDVAKIKVGDKGKIILDAYPEELFETELISINFAPIAGKTNTVYAVKFKLPENSNNRFLLEMGGEVELVPND